MSRFPIFAILLGLLIVVPVGSQPPAASQMPKPKPAGPRLVPIAETKLLMEGLNQPNFQALEKALKGEELDADSWAFARGQAILIAETSNLLMLRPPRNTGQDTWMKSSGEMREAATNLAQTLASRDRMRARTALVNLASTCNGCHQTFQVKTKVTAFAP